MEIVAGCGADLKRSVVAKQGESAESAMAHSWSDEEIVRLLWLVWRKKSAELQMVRKASESKLKEGSEPKVKKGTDFEEGGSGIKTDIEEEVEMIGEPEEGSEPTLKNGRMMDIPKEGSGIKTDIEEVEDDDQMLLTFRRPWIKQWSGQCGPFESATQIRPMPFTYDGAPKCAYPCDTLQIFSVRVAELFGGLELPLDVFGVVAVRDRADRKRTHVFFRLRDNCQTLTEKDPYLALTGPSRAVVLENVFVEFELKVRGKVESEDKYLSLDIAGVPTFLGRTRLHRNCYMSKRSSLALTYACITSSVEATIFIRAIEGSWPDGVHGQITALTPVIEHEKLVLLEFGADNVPVTDDGDVELSRHVVSVPVDGELLVSYNVWKDGIVAEQNALFKPATAGGSCATLQLDTCQLEIVVAWSVVSPEPDGTLRWR